MNLRTATARTVGGVITMIRAPAQTTVRIAAPGPLRDALQSAVERADANARKVAGTILGDEQLLGDAEVQRKVALGERETSPASRRSQPKQATERKARPKERPPEKPKARTKKPKKPTKKVRQARAGEAVSGFPEPPGADPGDISRDPEPHHALSNPVKDPDPTEWPDPYESRDDPRDPSDPDGRPFGEEPHPATGSVSTSEPHPTEDPEAGDRQSAPERDRLDD